MSKAASPTRFSGDYDHFYDPHFTADISQKMRVPKHIKINGDSDEDVQSARSNWSATSLVNEKIEMKVPDRILVAGQEQHIGVKGPPTELLWDNAVLPPSEEPLIRMQTPPHVITLDEHYFPSAAETVIAASQRDEDQPLLKPSPRYPSDHQLVPMKQTSPVSVEELTPSEELFKLRRQYEKLNRRVMAMEIDNLHRQQREKILYAIGLAYFFFKTVFWLSRS